VRRQLKVLAVFIFQLHGIMEGSKPITNDLFIEHFGMVDGGTHKAISLVVTIAPSLGRTDSQQNNFSKI